MCVYVFLHIQISNEQIIYDTKDSTLNDGFFVGVMRKSRTSTIFTLCIFLLDFIICGWMCLRVCVNAYVFTFQTTATETQNLKWYMRETGREQREDKTQKT